MSPRGKDYPSLCQPADDGYRLQIPVPGAEGQDIHVRIPPPCNVFVNETDVWPQWCFQLLVVASEYSAALHEFMTWSFPESWAPLKAQVARHARQLIRASGSDVAPGPGDDPAAHKVWAVFTYCYFHGLRKPSDIDPLSERCKATRWLHRLVGDAGWQADGCVCRAMAKWVSAMRARLQPLFPDIATATARSWAATELGGRLARRLESRGRKHKSVQEERYVPMYPYHVTGTWGENRFRLTIRTKECPRHYTGCCGLPHNFGQTGNCALGFLVPSDVSSAFTTALDEAARSWLGQQKERQQALIQDFYDTVLASDTAVLSNSHLQHGHPAYLVSCTLGWELALQQLPQWLDVASKSVETAGQLAIAPGAQLRLVMPQEQQQQQQVLPHTTFGQGQRLQQERQQPHHPGLQQEHLPYHASAYQQQQQQQQLQQQQHHPHHQVPQPQHLASAWATASVAGPNVAAAVADVDPPFLGCPGALDPGLQVSVASPPVTASVPAPPLLLFPMAGNNGNNGVTGPTATGGSVTLLGVRSDGSARPPAVSPFASMQTQHQCQQPMPPYSASASFSALGTVDLRVAPIQQAPTALAPAAGGNTGPAGEADLAGEINNMSLDGSVLAFGDSTLRDIKDWCRHEAGGEWTAVAAREGPAPGRPPSVSGGGPVPQLDLASGPLGAFPGPNLPGSGLLYPVQQPSLSPSSLPPQILDPAHNSFFPTRTITTVGPTPAGPEPPPVTPSLGTFLSLGQAVSAGAAPPPPHFRSANLQDTCTAVSTPLAMLKAGASKLEELVASNALGLPSRLLQLQREVAAALDAYLRQEGEQQPLQQNPSAPAAAMTTAIGREFPQSVGERAAASPPLPPLPGPSGGGAVLTPNPHPGLRPGPFGGAAVGGAGIPGLAAGPLGAAAPEPQQRQPSPPAISPSPGSGSAGNGLLATHGLSVGLGGSVGGVASAAGGPQSGSQGFYLKSEAAAFGAALGPMGPPPLRPPMAGAAHPADHVHGAGGAGGGAGAGPDGAVTLRLFGSQSGGSLGLAAMLGPLDGGGSLLDGMFGPGHGGGAGAGSVMSWSRYGGESLELGSPSGSAGRGAGGGGVEGGEGGDGGGGGGGGNEENERGGTGRALMTTLG